MEIQESSRIDALFERISVLIEQARMYVANSVNVAEVKTRFEVGRYIFEDEQQGERAAYGQRILKNLSVRLMEHYGNDWTYDTLVRCRKFYTAYHHAEIVATSLPQLEGERKRADNKVDMNCSNGVATIRLPRFTLSWSHYLILKRKNDALVELTLPQEANIYAQQYALCLPDKALLQQKLREWIAEFKGKEDNP